jgi:HPt (histidine-containing phosphotransfer) domain-containing protein
MSLLDPETKVMFLEESRQLLMRLNGKLPFNNDHANPEDLDELFLIYHSFKGNARMIGEVEMQDMFQALGILLLDVKDFNLELDDNIKSIFENSTEIIQSLLTQFEEGTISKVDVQNFRSKIVSLCLAPEQRNFFQNQEKQLKYFQKLGIGGPSSFNLDFFDGSSSFYNIRITLDNAVFLKKTRVYTIIRNLAMLDKSIKFGKMFPSLEDLLGENFDLEFSIVVQSNKTPQALEEIVNYSLEVASVEIHALSTKEAIDATTS